MSVVNQEQAGGGGQQIGKAEIGAHLVVLVVVLDQGLDIALAGERVVEPQAGEMADEAPRRDLDVIAQITDLGKEVAPFTEASVEAEGVECAVRCESEDVEKLEYDVSLRIWTETTHEKPSVDLRANQARA